MASKSASATIDIDEVVTSGDEHITGQTEGTMPGGRISGTYDVAKVDEVTPPDMPRSEPRIRRMSGGGLSVRPSTVASGACREITIGRSENNTVRAKHVCGDLLMIVRLKRTDDRKLQRDR